MRTLLSLFSKQRIGAEANSIVSTGMGRNPRFAWNILLSVFLALNIVSAAVGFFIYERINAGEIFLVEKAEKTQQNILNTFELEKKVSFFEGKRERFDVLRQAALRTRDPYAAFLTPKKK